MSKRVLSGLLSLTMVLVGSQYVRADDPVNAKQTLRNWEDASGIYSVEATFVKFAKGKVVIRKQDGGLLEIEVKRLSERDKQYVAGRLRAKQPKGLSKRPKRERKETQKKTQQETQDERPEAPKQEDRRQFKLASDDKVAQLGKETVPGQDRDNQIAGKTRDMWGIRWHTPPETLFSNDGPSADDKPIMWLRVLGALDGFM